jgi:uncharacterized protein
MQVLRHADYRRMPWRNGLGTTLEIARAPQGPGEFDWRLSLASLSTDGPFSAYPGFTRLVALVAGRGFALTVDGRERAVLETIGAHASFPGGAVTHCRVLGGPCSDLSLMVRCPGTIIAVRGPAPQIEDLALPAASLQAVFVLAGAASVTLRVGPATGLCAQDTLLLGGAADCTLHAAPGAALLQIAWTAAG